jgi:hypothetical protein
LNDTSGDKSVTAEVQSPSCQKYAPSVGRRSVMMHARPTPAGAKTRSRVIVNFRRRSPSVRSSRLFQS